MSIFRSDTQQYEAKLVEEFLYAEVSKEMTNGVVSPGLYAKAMAECNGDEKLANARYISLRVDMMRAERAARSQQQKLIAYAEKQTPPRIGPVVRTFAILLGAIFVYLPFTAAFDFMSLLLLAVGGFLLFCGATGYDYLATLKASK